MKPFSFQRFVKAISKIPTKNAIQTSDNNDNTRKELFIKSGYEHIKITIDDILYIKSDADYTEIFLPDKKHLSSEPLRYWLENLDNNQFMRIHKSYIINISKIEKVASNQVFLNEKTIIPIGRAFKENFTARFLK